MDKNNSMNNNFFEIGKAYFFRGITYHWVGRIVAIDGSFLRLENASWVADSGRFGEAIAQGTLQEMEYTGDAYVNLSAMNDIVPWNHALPTQSQ